MWIEIGVWDILLKLVSVTPFAGVWIEIIHSINFYYGYKVTPFAGVWIEMLSVPTIGKGQLLSLPSRECGLKSAIMVAYFMYDRSLPSRECGLK